MSIRGSIEKSHPFLGRLPRLNRCSQPSTTAVIARGKAPWQSPGRQYRQTQRQRQAPHPKPPLLKGGGRAKARSEGFAAATADSPTGFGALVHTCRLNPPPINCSSNLWAAPFDKGAMIGAYLRQIRSAAGLPPPFGHPPHKCGGQGVRCLPLVWRLSPLNTRRLPEGELPRRGKRGHPGVRRFAAHNDSGGRGGGCEFALVR